MDLLTKEQREPETIAEIKAQRARLFCSDVDDGLNQFMRAMPAVDKLIEIVDYRARKIEAMQKQLNAYSLITEAARSLIKAPDLHCDICRRCKSDEDGSYCSVDNKRIDDVLECPPWCIERG